MVDIFDLQFSAKFLFFTAAEPAVYALVALLFFLTFVNCGATGPDRALLMKYKVVQNHEKPSGESLLTVSGAPWRPGGRPEVYKVKLKNRFRKTFT